MVILDDFGLQALDSANKITLLEIIKDRQYNGSIIVTLKIPVQGWYDIIGEKPLLMLFWTDLSISLTAWNSKGNP